MIITHGNIKMSLSTPKIHEKCHGTTFLREGRRDQIMSHILISLVKCSKTIVIFVAKSDELHGQNVMSEAASLARVFGRLTSVFATNFWPSWL